MLRFSIILKRVIFSSMLVYIQYHIAAIRKSNSVMVKYRAKRRFVGWQDARNRMRIN